MCIFDVRFNDPRFFPDLFIFFTCQAGRLKFLGIHLEARHAAIPHHQLGWLMFYWDQSNDAGQPTPRNKGLIRPY